MPGLEPQLATAAVSPPGHATCKEHLGSAFTDPATRAETGAWWRRQPLGL
jgi:hypothetical protein